MTRELGEEGGNKDRPRPFKDLKTNTKTWALECIGNQNSCNVPTAQQHSAPISSRQGRMGNSNIKGITIIKLRHNKSSYYSLQMKGRVCPLPVFLNERSWT